MNRFNLLKKLKKLPSWLVNVNLSLNRGNGTPCSRFKSLFKAKNKQWIRILLIRTAPWAYRYGAIEIFIIILLFIRTVPINNNNNIIIINIIIIIIIINLMPSY